LTMLTLRWLLLVLLTPWLTARSPPVRANLSGRVQGAGLHRSAMGTKQPKGMKDLTWWTDADDGGAAQTLQEEPGPRPVARRGRPDGRRLMEPNDPKSQPQSYTQPVYFDGQPCAIMLFGNLAAS